MTLLMLQCSLCDAPMMNLANPCRISILLVLVLCSGCIRGLFPLGEPGVAAPPPTRAVQAAPAPAVSPTPAVVQSVAANPERKKKDFVADTGADFTYHNATLTEDVAWSGKVSVRGVLTIAPQATLTVGPGTVVTFRPDDQGTVDGALLVRGRLCVRGTAGQPVLFMPGTRTIAPGDWQGILLLGSEKKNLLEHCRIEGAVTGLEAIFSTVSLKGADIAACRAGVRAKGSLFTSSGGGASGCELGYALLDSESDIRDAVFAGNGTGLLLSGGALRLTLSRFSSNAARALEAKGARLSVLSGSFTGNGSGLVLHSSEGEVTASTVADNLEFGVRLTRSRMRLSGNVISRNTGAGLIADDGDASVWGNTISSNGTYDLYYAGSEDLRVPGNWWGTSSPLKAKKRIYDQEADPQRGRVLMEPWLAEAPGKLP